MSKGLPGSAAWQMAQKICAAKLVMLFVVWSIPMSLLRRKSCSALASTIFESPLHRTKATCTRFFCAICQAALPGRPFDTRIHIGKFSEIPIWQKAIIALRRSGSMSLPRPAAGGESCKQDSFFPYRKFLRQKGVD